MPKRNYIFYEFTRSMCNECMQLIDAKIIFADEKVWMLKRCHTHGEQKELISDDIEFYKLQKNFIKPWDQANQPNTEIERGCPYDCGLCPDHEQHSCLSIVEITDSCNMKCPVCYANSEANLPHKSLEDIEKMFDVICKNEDEPDIVQISGGEPTIHPDFFEILERAKKRPFRYLMVNTNGIKIASDEEFTKKLSTYLPNFEIYLQFDSLNNEEYTLELRGQYMKKVREKCLENLEKYDIPVTIVVVVQRGKNEQEIGDIIRFALGKKNIRGITFQLVQSAGRYEGYPERVTISELRREICTQTENLFTPEDILPIPCHPECIAMCYALKNEKGGIMPLGRHISREQILAGAENRIMFEQNADLKKHFINLFSLWANGEKAANCFGSLLCCLPWAIIPAELKYKNVFRIMIVQFLDKYNFDIKSVKRSCMHFAKEDGKMYPFDTYNMLYRK